MHENKLPANQREAYLERCVIFGKNMRIARKEMGFTSVTLAGFLGVSTAYVGLIERGERTPSIEMLFKICDFFGKSVDTMLTPPAGSSSSGEKKPRTRLDKRQSVAYGMIRTFDEYELAYLIGVMKSFKALQRKQDDGDDEDIN